MAFCRNFAQQKNDAPPPPQKCMHAQTLTYHSPWQWGVIVGVVLTTVNINHVLSSL